MSFAAKLIAWQRRHGRHGLPWQGTRDPYRIWLSEVMLQQTQVTTVIPYYERFLARFPTIEALAAADQESVLRLWSGFGYYARARNLHAAARRVVEIYGGKFPQNVSALAELPGIGLSTAAAIAAFAFNQRAAILDGNVKRVLCRHFGIEGWPGLRAVEKSLWAIAEQLLPEQEISAYTQATMDLGATVCTRAKPHCDKCPVVDTCVARREQRVHLLPTSPPPKKIPQRHVTWLILRKGNRVLLRRRSNTGLWGGLWTFPEIMAAKSSINRDRPYGCIVSARKKLKPIEHGFTHFRLRIRPILCDVSGPVGPAKGKELAWVRLGKPPQLPMPAPVSKLFGYVSSISDIARGGEFKALPRS